MADDQSHGRLAVTIFDSSVDDLLRQALERILSAGEMTHPSKGDARELQAVTLELANPRARLSRSESRGRLFSCLGEVCWYLSGSKALDDIAYYVPAYAAYPGPDHHAAYGPRLFDFDGVNQVQYVIEKLRANPWSRRAVIQLFDHRDVPTDAEVPCTCTLQFLVRAGELHLIAYLRSNDIHLGLPHDVFCFTMLQELVARSLSLAVGHYVHVAGSLHLYAIDEAKAKTFISEGWQSHTEMPAMPPGDPWPHVQHLLASAAALRGGSDPLSADFATDPYWADLLRLLAIFALIKSQRFFEVAPLKAALSTRVYDVFIEDRTNGK